MPLLLHSRDFLLRPQVDDGFRPTDRRICPHSSGRRERGTLTATSCLANKRPPSFLRRTGLDGSAHTSSALVVMVASVPTDTFDGRSLLIFFFFLMWQSSSFHSSVNFLNSSQKNPKDAGDAARNSQTCLLSALKGNDPLSDSDSAVKLAFSALHFFTHSLSHMIKSGSTMSLTNSPS